MRTDVKIGIALGAVVLIVAVSYYGTQRDDDIPLAGSKDSVESANEKTIQDLFAANQSRKQKPTKASPARGSQRGKTNPRPRKANGSRAADQPSSSQHQSVDLPRKPKNKKSSPHANATTEPETEVASDEVGPGVPTPAKRRPRGRNRARSIGRTPPPRTGKPAGNGAATVADGARKPLPPAADIKRPAQGEPRTTPNSTRSATPKPVASGLPKTTRPKTLPKPKRSPIIRTHVIEAGDNFALLSDHYYGDQKFARFLAEANPGVEPYRMKIGMKIKIPPIPRNTSAAPKRRPAHPGSNQYAVREGDTLYAVSARLLGSGARWTEIYELNRGAIGVNPSNIRVGQILDIPKR